jgi:predicted amidohydrolase YtcJ
MSPRRGERPGAADHTADVVFENGAVYTVDPAQEWAKAVAVKDKRVVYVGDDAGVAAFKGPKTRVVDLAGRMLMPGFIEGHTHALFGAVATRGVDLQYDTHEDTVAALRHYADTAPDRGRIDGLVRGFGWRYSAFPASGPTKADLDAIWPDVPALLIAVDGHSAWVNSRALQLAGVNADNAVVVEGFSYFYQACRTCEPTGYVVEAPAIAQLTSKVAPYTRQFLVESLEEWVPRAAAVGITGVFDAGIAVTGTEDGYAIYSDLERRGKLPFRIVGSLYYNDPGLDPFPQFEQLRDTYQSELVQFTTLKVTMDGVDANGSAAMLEPYADRTSSGETLFTAQQTNDLIRKADAKGIDVHVHAIGDRAARQTLDAIAAAIAVNPGRDRRHTIAHNQLTDPADLPRFGQLGVIAQFSGQWHCKDGKYWSEVTVVRWGVERASRQYRIAEILRLGGRVSLGTDWPASSNSSVYAPLHAIQIAVTRQEIDKPSDPPLPTDVDRLSLAQALHANTMGSAYHMRIDDKVGSIRAGKLADLIVLDRNLFAIDVHDIAATRVDMTMMNGRFTHGD